MIEEEKIHDISESIMDSLKGLTYLEAIAVLEVIKHNLITQQST